MRNTISLDAFTFDHYCINLSAILFQLTSNQLADLAVDTVLGPNTRLF